MKLLWLTDIHLDFLDFLQRMMFYKQIKEHGADCIVITGDLAHALCLSQVLIDMEEYLNVPIYFVLGNHDYYHSSVKSVRTEIKRLCSHHHNLHWMGGYPAISLTSDTLLTGHDTWADGRYGNFDKSHVRLNDEKHIMELIQVHYLSRTAVQEQMQNMADHDVQNLREQIINGIKIYTPKTVIVLMHVPPFKETCLYNEQESCENYLPFFASKANGDLLMEIAALYPDISFMALCGHTHHKALYQPLPNLVVHVEAAEYLKPDVGRMIMI